jgi:hypothetical protein
MLMVSTTSTVKVAKKKKTTLIEGLGWVFAFMEIFAGCAFGFGSLLGVSFSLACEARGKLLIYLLKLGSVEFETYLGNLFEFFIFFLFLIQCY